MKNRILVSAIFILTLSQFTQAQITNTFPLNDSVGIGTTTPREILEVQGDMRVGWMGLITVGGEGSTILGNDAMKSNTTGSFNTAIGDNSLFSNSTGSYNTAIGQSSLSTNSIGSFNTAIGNNALPQNIGGAGNTAVGSGASYFNKTGSNNVAIGGDALHSSYKGSYNAALGSSALFYNTKGNNNTAIGTNALDFNKSGNNNTALGYNADVSAINLTNATAIGNGALVDASNKVRIGNASITSNGGQVEWTAYSDARIKTDVKENVPGLEFINLLKPITYHFDVDKQNQLQGIHVGEKQDGMYEIEKIQWTGFLAQDVDAAAKKINYDFSGVDKSGELMGLRYSSFVVPIVKSIQELSSINAEKDEEIKTLQQENEIMNGEIESLAKRISRLEKFITKQGIVLSDETTENEISKTQITLQGDAEVASLSQNIPNPFTGKTSINYFVPLTAASAQIKIANSNGQSLFLADVKLGAGVLEIEASQLAAGTYSYTLLVDGKVMDTKLMVIAK